MKRVFVSYSRRNKAFCERISRDLSDAGLDVWVDFRQIQGGELWQKEIYRGIERSEIVVFCLSPASVTSEWCRREVIAARDQGKHIIPVMLQDAFAALNEQDDMKWMLDLHILMFEERYEAAFPELLDALPGVRRVGVYDDVPVEKIPNPFKGLEAFQQTDTHFFFGREELIKKSLQRLRQDRKTRFLAVVGASGSGKSSLVRAGVIPQIRAGALPGSDQWPMIIFTPGAEPVQALATRLLPLLGEDYQQEKVVQQLKTQPESLSQLAEQILDGTPQARLLMVVDQFEEVFTRAAEEGRTAFLKLLYLAATVTGGRVMTIITMRADFFGNLSRYPDLAELFEQENMIIATEMTAANLLRTIEGPAAAVGLVYDDGLVDRILEDVRRQPGSLPLLQYALKELYERRDGRRLTTAAYEAIGGVKRALAQHAEDIYSQLNAAQQAIMRRVLLRLIEVSPNGEATRRRADRADLTFRDVPDAAVQDVIDLLTAQESRLLIASREINADDKTAPVTWIEISHEALIREWERFNGWVVENVEQLRFGSEVLKLANDWLRAGRDVAYLLTGNRLVRGEIWLEAADATTLQREFILASIEERKRRETQRLEQQARELELQKQATNRLRYFVGVLVISLIVAAALTFFALNSQRQATENANNFGTAVVVADENAQKAQRNAVEASSLALAASADRFFADGNTALAMALAVESAQISDPPPQTQFTLANIAYAPGIRQRLEGHSAAVNSVAYAPDGHTALSASSDKSILLWDLASGSILRRFEGHTGAVNSVAYAPDGTQMASAADDSTLMIWNLADGTVLHKLAGHTGRLTSVAYSPDGRYLATGSTDQSIILWDTADGTLLRRLQAHTDAVTSVAFSPDSLLLVSGGRDQQVILWDVTTGFAVRTFGGASDNPFRHSGPVLAVAYSPDGTQIASAAGDDSTILWSVADGKAIRQFIPLASTLDDQQTGDIYSVAFNPAGNRIATTSVNGRIYVWDVASGDEATRFSASQGVLKGGHSSIVTSVAYSPDGRFIITGGATDMAVIRWDVQQAEQIRNFGDLGSFVQTVAFSPDGRTAISGATTVSGQGDLRLWNVENGNILQQFIGHEAAVNAAVYSPDGSMLLSGDNNGRIILWETASGQQIRTFNGHSSGVYALAFTPDGTKAVSGSRDKTLIIWDVATGQPIGQPLTGHDSIIFAVAITPDGKQVLSGSLDTRVIVWDMSSGQLIQRYENHARGVRSLAISPDGKQVVSGASDGSLVLWDLATGAEIRRFSGHRSGINSVAFSPDGRAVLSGSVDGTIRLWEIASAFEIRRYTTRGAGVLALAFGPDGLSVVSGMTDRSFRLWRVLPTVKQLLDWTFANRFVPELECAQRQQFGIQPLCDQSELVPTRTPYPLPTPTLVPETGRLVIGGSALVNTTAGDTLNLRQNPGLKALILGRLANGDNVTLVDGPRIVDGLTWWKISTGDYGEGWVVESVDNIQTLLP